MQRYLLLVLMLLTSSAAFAQPARPGRRPDSLAARGPAPAAPDTLAAIHRMFATKRKRCMYLVGGTALATAAGTVIVASSTPYDTGPGSFQGLDRGINITLVGAVGVGILGSRLIYYHQYNRKHEQKAVAAFEARRLPRDLRRRLKPKFFR